ncbi:cora-domain-containing protein [Aaosphaeria arxii CBS 175.79]|uniref:Cora-domain-containing protein n=1 Tax=Aaosphaeria arxii CBS 175.79 TaxID=1450172 RepID=A0A6A5X661_9PLEO|nr:cora-domain-containing protein [Aaosphaeria arxii CBS 175.79]KAF2008443.1 cora-domain-containing protein [Aaosphaeria arxii CBS 175.79]
MAANSPRPSAIPPHSSLAGASAASQDNSHDNAAQSATAGTTSGQAKKRKHRGGKKRRNRRQSFATTAAAIGADDEAEEERPSLANNPASSSFYRLTENHSNTSLESEALLDHRDQTFLQARRQSVQLRSSPHTGGLRSKLSRQQPQSDSEDDDGGNTNDQTPLMSSSQRDVRGGGSYGGLSAPSSAGRARRGSTSSINHRRPAFTSHHSQTNLDDYDVNNPPSVPASPVIGPNIGFDDVMLTADVERSRSDDTNRNRSRDVLIDIDEESGQGKYSGSSHSSPKGPSEFRRRMTALQAAEDVCFPLEGMSEIGPEDYLHRPESEEPRRRRRRRWPDLGVLESWSREEKEQRTMEGLRTRKVSEPLMVGGRLRPQKYSWHREADDAPYRFTYFNEEFDNTVHSQTISELVQPGQTFRDLFIPEPPVIEDSSDDETDEEELAPLTRDSTLNGNSKAGLRPSSRVDHIKQHSSGEQTRSSTPAAGSTTPKPDQEKPKRYGPRPAFWLDVLSPTDAEMKVISKAFSIHPLTAEDILMQEAREKVELFKHYYFINYRTFEQDETSEDYLEPVNLYVVVFREGVISFHFSMTPHPANVRRRIRQLQDYLILSPDWISYGIIDDITDAYAPLIQRIEEDVDDIDEAILRLHSGEDEQEAKKSKSFPYPYGSSFYEKGDTGTKEGQDSGRDMLRRVGECRKKVMSLYRLLGNKADVIKGFAKRCNEQWDVAPRSEIGLYLGDIQDHIVTMTSNLSHYENLLSRAHSNYLAQINIRMNERQEKTSDILGKLTVMGTIVLPMNVVTGIWGMNCLVPGQDIENLNWFWCITASLIVFGLTCYFIAKRIYGIV